MKKLLSLLIVVAAVVMMAVPVMAAGSANTAVSLTATIGSAGQPSTICATFQTPDDQPTVNSTQFAPVPGSGRTTKFYVLADDPNGITDIAGIDISVFYPTFAGAKSGTEKFNAQAVLINGVWTPEDLASAVRVIQYNTVSDYVDINADDVGANPATANYSDDIGIVPALQTMDLQGRIAYGPNEVLGDSGQGIIHDVMNGKQLILEITVNIDPCEPHLIYTVNTLATDAEGNTTGGLTPAPVVNHFEYLSVTALVTDFTSINWGQINIGKENLITGDNNINTTNSPTVENLGNDRAMISLYATPMTGSGLGKQIKNFDAKMNQLATTDAYGALAIQHGYIQFNSGVTATINEGVDLSPVIGVATPTNTPVVLPPCSTAQIDFSIFPPNGTPAGTYTGTMTISIREWQASVTNPVYSVLATN
jgi:hypothetical protein